jgi:hypothetical protein
VFGFSCLVTALTAGVLKVDPKAALGWISPFHFLGVCLWAFVLVAPLAMRDTFRYEGLVGLLLVPYALFLNRGAKAKEVQNKSRSHL